MHRFFFSQHVRQAIEISTFIEMIRISEECSSWWYVVGCSYDLYPSESS